MPNRQFSELYDLILPYVPAVETPLVDYHIRRVTREFCRRTTLWRHRVTITTEPGVNDYLLSPYDATEGVIGGGGGGPGGWVPASEAAVTVATQVTSSTVPDAASVTYNPTTSIWSVQSEDEYAYAFNMINAYVSLTPPMRARLTLVPIYYQIGINEWFEASSDSGLSRSYFNVYGPDGFIGDVNNGTAGDSTQLTSFEPNPISVYEVDGVTPQVIQRFEINQGSGFESGSILAFSALLEVFQTASTPDPEICDPYSIISVTCDSRPINPLAEDRREPYGARPANAKPQAWYSPSARVVHLYPTPDAAYTVVVDVVCALTMTPTNPVMPEFLFVDYREIIADGVVASLKALGNKPWYDPEGASQYARRYANAVQGIRGKLRDGNQPNVSTARGPRFGR